MEAPGCGRQAGLGAAGIAAPAWTAHGGGDGGATGVGPVRTPVPWAGSSLSSAPRGTHSLLKGSQEGCGGCLWGLACDSTHTACGDAGPARQEPERSAPGFTPRCLCAACEAPVPREPLSFEVPEDSFLRSPAHSPRHCAGLPVDGSGRSHGRGYPAGGACRGELASAGQALSLPVLLVCSWGLCVDFVFLTCCAKIRRLVY